MRAQVPVSMHRRDESAADLSNRDSFLSVDLPISEPDPLRRLELINAETVERKDLHDADALYALLPRSLARRPAVPRGDAPRGRPARVQPLDLERPGAARTGLRARRRVSDLHSIAEPADRHALGSSAVSLAGTMHIALCTDPDALPGLHRLGRGIERSVEELVELA